MQLADRLRSFGMTVLGIVLSLVPPALWVAWSEEILLAVAATGVVSAVLLVLLSEFRNPDVGNGEAIVRANSRAVLTDESVAEVHRLFPLTYHHGRRQSARFRQGMQQVRQLIGSSETVRR
jgi:hypothetical protein